MMTLRSEQQDQGRQPGAYLAGVDLCASELMLVLPAQLLPR
jgi:hypothetical protein